jgi:uncharacterized protein YegP (UPF0339 family)
MPHKFSIVPAKDKQFRVQFGYNGEIMVWSENYKTKASASNCVESIKKNAPGASVVDLKAGETGKGYRFELAEAKNGQSYVRFVAANGEPMVVSETYKSRSSAKNCIKSVMTRAAGAAVSDETLVEKAAKPEKAEKAEKPAKAEKKAKAEKGKGKK